MPSNQPGDQIVTDVLEVAAARLWDELKLMLHPYLHWTRDDGVTLRGRTNVLLWLASQPTEVRPPARVELRDEQIYRRWST
jgi:hypothetical protein